MSRKDGKRSIFPRMKPIETCTRCRIDFLPQGHAHTAATCHIALPRAIHAAGEAATVELQGPLLLRCRNIIDRMRQHGSVWDINVQTPDSGDTALHLAAHYRFVGLIQDMLGNAGHFLPPNTDLAQPYVPVQINVGLQNAEGKNALRVFLDSCVQNGLNFHRNGPHYTALCQVLYAFFPAPPTALARSSFNLVSNHHSGFSVFVHIIQRVGAHNNGVYGNPFTATLTAVFTRATNLLQPAWSPVNGIPRLRWVTRVANEVPRGAVNALVRTHALVHLPMYRHFRPNDQFAQRYPALYNQWVQIKAGHWPPGQVGGGQFHVAFRDWVKNYRHVPANIELGADVANGHPDAETCIICGENRRSPGWSGGLVYALGVRADSTYDLAVPTIRYCIGCLKAQLAMAVPAGFMGAHVPNQRLDWVRNHPGQPPNPADNPHNAFNHPIRFVIVGPDMLTYEMFCQRHLPPRIGTCFPDIPRMPDTRESR